MYNQIGTVSKASNGQLVVKNQGKMVAPLPLEFKADDLEFPSYKSNSSIGYDEMHKLGLEYDDLRFELWYVANFGWCIPTLLISKAGRRRPAGTPDRTYAIMVDGGRGCRIGRGPHVTAQLTVYVTKKNIERLRKFIDLRKQGQVQANETRDRISTRRMLTQQLRRSWGY